MINSFLQGLPCVKETFKSENMLAGDIEVLVGYNAILMWRAAPVNVSDRDRSEQRRCFRKTVLQCDMTSQIYSVMMGLEKYEFT